MEFQLAEYAERLVVHPALGLPELRMNCALILRMPSGTVQGPLLFMRSNALSNVRPSPTWRDSPATARK